VATVLGIGILFIAITNMWVVSSTSDQIYQNIEALPSHKVGLVLGTSYRTKYGDDNPFFISRVKKAADLFNHGRIKTLLLSGANNSQYYNEPKEMKRRLIELGVPDSSIILDESGLRTLDSIVRSKEVFRQNDLIIITQEFHAYRALFIGNFYCMQVDALITDPLNQKHGYGVFIREYLARPMAVIDLYLLKTRPKNQNR